MRISIVTLNYNGSNETIKLLKSLENQTDTDFEISVIDNASEEADFANLSEVIHTTTFNVVSPPRTKQRHAAGPRGFVRGPQVVRNSQNLGFSGGNNVGIQQALKSEVDWVILLNNDIWAEKDFMRRLRAILGAKTGIVGIPLLEGDRVAYCGNIYIFVRI